MFKNNIARVTLDFSITSIMIVKEFMTKNPATLGENDTLKDAVEIFCNQRVQGIPVLSDDGAIVGIISKSMVTKLLANQIPRNMKVAEFMRRDVWVMDENSDIRELIKWPISTMPIVRKGNKSNLQEEFVGVCYLEDTISAYYSATIKTQYMLSTMIESIDQGLVVMDESRNEVLINTKARELLGIKEHYVSRGDIISLMRICGIKAFALNVEAIYSGQGKINGKKLKFEIRKSIDKINNWHTTVIIIREERNQEKGIVHELDEKDLTPVFLSEEGKNLVDTMLCIANVKSTILITGESGTGKEVAANYIVSNSSRKNGPFIKINCGAIPENLVESELFGYATGSFTGAKKGGKVGAFEAANGGTIFLDEISELPLHQQVKLLRVIQESEIVRIGSSTPVKIDVRIIAATNENLKEKVERKEFREDLWYRLNVIHLKMPPLRERKEDIRYLAEKFLQNCEKKYGIRKSISEAGFKDLLDYDWPGNIRELENLIERKVILTKSDVIDSFFSEKTEEKTEWLSKIDRLLDIYEYREIVEMVDRRLIENSLQKYKSTYKAAEALGVSQSTIVKKMKRYKNRE